MLGRMMCVLALALTLGGTARAQTVDVAAAVSELEPEVQRMLIEGRVPSATIALVVGDSVVWTDGYGYANRWARTPAVPSTVYLIGSTFKAMSTVALLQQHAAGHFDLDDAVHDYLPATLPIRSEDPNRPVTFRHLLTHTSGLPPAFGAYFVWSDSVPPPLPEYLARDLEVVSPPMDSVRYSNLAYSLVAYMVERFSGTPFRQYIKANLFAPLEMMSTDFEPSPEMEERLATPYVPDPVTGAQIAAPRLKADVWPAGIVYGTVGDLANWLAMNLNGGDFRGHRFIPAELIDAMQTVQWDAFRGPMTGGFGNTESGYGLTWWVMDEGGDRFFAHSGSVPGYTAFLMGNRTKRLGVAMLTNGHRAHPHLVRLARRALAILDRHRQN